jgi:hypothetical protein
MLFAKITKKEIKMAYAVIELLMFSFALNPLFRKHNVLVAQLKNK